jgi:Na+-driven multidrug efflux pump
MFLVTLLSAAETYFVSSLGTDAIAAASLVVPVTPCCEVQLLDYKSNNAREL